MTNTLYLNNRGDKWITVDNHGKRTMPFALVLPDGTVKRRKADYYEAFGNFAAIVFRYRGQVYRRLARSFDQIDGLPVVDLELHTRWEL